jgi:hypothetical protein
MDSEPREHLTKLGDSQQVQPHTLPRRGGFATVSSAQKSPLPGPPQYTIAKSADDAPAKHGSAGEQPEMQLFTLPSSRRTSTPSKSTDYSLPKFEPVVYVKENATNSYLAQYVGTAAYYKSRKFKKKEANGKARRPGPSDHATPSSELVAEEPKVSASLVMIFGATNVRRASLQRKFELRLQRTNRRM